MSSTSYGIVFENEGSEQQEGVWLDDGDCIICSICDKAFDARYVERKGDCVRAPFHCPLCKSYMKDIKRA